MRAREAKRANQVRSGAGGLPRECAGTTRGVMREREAQRVAQVKRAGIGENETWKTKTTRQCQKYT